MAITSIVTAVLVLTQGIGSPPPHHARACWGPRSSGHPVVGSPGVATAPFTTARTATVPQLMFFQRGRPRVQTSDELQQAEALMQNQKFAEAESQLQSLSATQSDNPQVWFDLGFTESHLKKSSEAAAAYKKAVELSPTWFEANLNLGLALAQAGDREAAATALRAATGLKPATLRVHQVANAWFSLGQVLEESDK